MATLASLSLSRDHGADADADLDLEPLTVSNGNDNAHDQQLQKQKNAKRQRKNVLIVNFLAVLFTLGIFSILLEYTAIADRTRARTASMHRPSHLTSDTDEAMKSGGATHLYASVVDVYNEDEEDQESEGTPLPSLAYQQNLPLDELLQLNQLYDACMTQNNSLIDGAASPSFPFSLGENAPTELLLKTLRACPDVDVFVPAAARGNNEYCQDAAVYAKFLQSRMLPRWVLDVELRDEAANTTVTYFDLCPRTPMLFLNHHWDALLSHPKWPNQTKGISKKKPVYFMPNIDSIELQREHLLSADVVLCKTKLCFSRVSAWYAQETQRSQRAIATKVLYTRHTSPNPSVPLQVQGVAIRQKDYANPSFVHFAGDLKGTRQVLECWLSRPELPQLAVLMSDAALKESGEFEARLHSSGNVIMDTQGPSQWSQRMAEASFLLAPSESESFGHAINQVRATGGVVITTDVAPMNELLPSSDGVLVRAKRRVNPKQLLGSGFVGGAEGLQGGKGLVAEFSAKSVCDAVDALLHNMQEQTRQALGVRAHRQYYADMAVFAAAMAELRAHARDESDETEALASSQPPVGTRVPEGVQRLGNLRVDTAAFSIPPPAASS